MTGSASANPLQHRIDRSSQEAAVLQTMQMLFELDPHARHELVAHLDALTEAQNLRDEEAVSEALYSIEELLQSCRGGYKSETNATLEEWEEDLAEDDQYAHASAELRKSTREFLARYLNAKKAAGLDTQAAVAAAAKLSVNTICAIETESVKPQYRTIQKLADGLKVDPTWLATGEGSGPQSGPR